MDTSRCQLVLALALMTLCVGCGLNTAVLQRGGNDRHGVLLNYSCGAHPCDPIDPSKPTIVITHGWNPLPTKIRTTFGSAGAQALRCRCGDSYNILSWDWNAVKVPVLDNGPIKVGHCQGRMLASALRARGVNPRCTQIIAHSLGTLVAAKTAACMSDMGPFAQLTLLDPPSSMHEEIFCNLAVTKHACVVENYWSPGISGYGDHAAYRGVRNYTVEGQNPVIGIVDLSLSNHVYVMRWYHETMCCPSMPCGFQNSVFVDCCGKANCLCPGCVQGEFVGVPEEPPTPPVSEDTVPPASEDTTPPASEDTVPPTAEDLVPIAVPEPAEPAPVPAE